MRSRWLPPIYFTYLLKRYIRNFIAILFGISFAFAFIDYFQHMQSLQVSWNYKILYVFYMWEQALGLLYPLAIVFALIMTKLSLVRNSTMTVLYAFGYNSRQLLKPFLLTATAVYLLFVWLNTTEFAYSKDKAKAMLQLRIGEYSVHDIFFKYHQTFVYMKSLDPAARIIYDMTLFKVEEYRVRYTMHAKRAVYDGESWEAKDVEIKQHIYDDKGDLQRYETRYEKEIATLKGYKPKIIESLYEGEALNLIDAVKTWKLLKEQKVDTDKIRAAFYEKTVTPIFALAMLIILFFKMPYHARMINLGWVSALSIGATFVIWGVLFGLNQLGKNGVILPEFASIFPVVLLCLYAIWLYIRYRR